MDCLQRIYPSSSAYLPSQAMCLCGLRVALGIIAACGLSLSIGAIVSYFPPSVGYTGGAVTVFSLGGLALSYIKCSTGIQQSRQESPVDSAINSSPVCVPSSTDHVGHVRSEEKPKISNQPIQPIVLGNYALPNEIVVHILRYLAPKELVAMSLTNKSWRAIACDNILWARHCRDYLIPVPQNAEVIGSYAEKFSKAQKLTAAIIRREVDPKPIDFEKPVYAVLIDGNKAFLSRGNEIQIWDAELKSMSKTLMSSECDCFSANRLQIIGNVLFWLCAPTPSSNKGILFAYDLVGDVQLQKDTSIGLYEWEHGLSKHREGRLAFSKDKAFCNYVNGDIRVWDLTKGYEVYTDEIEYEDCNEQLRSLEEECRVQTEEYKFYANLVESSRQEQERSKRERRVLQGHTGQITHLSVSGNRLYSSSEDGTIRIWDIDTLQCIRIITTDLPLSKYGSKVQGVEHFVVNDNYIFGYLDSNKKGTLCKLWDVNTGLCLQTLELNACMDSYCLHGNLLFFSHKNTIHIYDLRTGQEIRTLGCDVSSHKSHATQEFMNLQIIDNKLICIGKDKRSGLRKFGQRIFIFDLSSEL